MEFPTLTVTERHRAGKGPSRRVRSSGLIPGVVYGRDVERPLMISVNLSQLRKAISGKHGRNTVIRIVLDGKEEKSLLAMLQDYQIHPATRKVLHMDFLTVDPNRPIEVKIPIAIVGKAAGVTRGGILMEIIHEIPMSCLPEKIPTEIQVDVSKLDIGQTLKVSDLQAPEGTKFAISGDQPIVSVTTVKEEKEVAEAAPAEGAVQEGAPAGTGAAAAKEKEGAGGEKGKEEKPSKEGKEKEKKEK